jgi:N-acylglucosamine-6-phosphate 2-epimerase
VAAAGARVVAADATRRPRPDGLGFVATVAAVHGAGRLVMADVATVDEGLLGAAEGADLIATTLSDGANEPDLALVAALREHLPAAVIVAEGRFHSPAQAVAALRLGATSVVVGTAITDPAWITGTFADAMGEAA